MNRHHCSRFLALGLGAAVCVFGQDQGIDVNVKIRGGSVFKSTTSAGAGHVTYGIGAEVAYHLPQGRAVFGELYSTYYSCWDYRANMPKQGYVIGTGALATLDPRYNADRRKDNAEGYGVKLGYRALLLPSLSWQAGFSLDRLKGKQEVSGMLSAGATSVTPAVYEDMAKLPTSQKVVAGAFVGLRWDLVEGVALDASLVNAGYSRPNWMPYTYTGQAAHVETSTERRTSLECAIVMRF